MADVRQATAQEVGTIGAVLARAFYEDPVFTYFFPDDERRARRTPSLFRREAARVRRTGEVWCGAGIEAAALWSAPGRWRVTGLDAVREAPTALLFGRRIPLAFRYLQELEKAHPRQPHWYLGVLGTDPLQQGKGFGSAVMAPVLKRCDESGVAAYLESSKEANVPFYERHGFRVTRELTVKGGPTEWLMWRDPQEPQT